MDIESALGEFLLACAADGLAPATVQWYTSLLSDFAEHFPGSGLDQITATLIRQYIVLLQSRKERYIDAPQKPPQMGGLAAASVAGHIRALHTFWAWCVTEYRLPQNPMENIRRQRKLPAQPKAIRPSDFVRLFEATGPAPTGSRDRAMLVFLADTGCRLGGLLSLRLEDLEVEDHRAWVHEKGQTTRRVVFTHYTAQILQQWVAVRHSVTPYVFCNIFSGQKLTASGVNQLLKRLKKRAGVTGRVNPHSFRHNFAREYLRNGGDLVTLAKLLGHSDISSTAANYAVFSENELAAFHERFSPMRDLQEKIK